MKKKVVCLLLTVMLSLTVTSCGNATGNVSSDTSSAGTESSIAKTVEDVTGQLSTDTGVYFSDGDYKNVTEEEPNALITLSGESGTISDTTRGTSGETVTITSKGIYRVSGSSKNVTIKVQDDNESGNVYLVLDNVTMENDSQPCILVEAADKVIIQCVGTNQLTYSAKESKYDGAIYAKDDITVNGEGELKVVSTLHGIVCKKDVKLTGGVVSVEADSIGIQSQKTVRIDGADIRLNTGHDGIQIDGATEDCYLYLASGNVSITAGYDGIDVGADSEEGSGNVLLVGGSLEITAGGGSDSSKNSGTSQKGIKSSGDIKIGELSLAISSADDALHASGNVFVTGGDLKLSTSDDGIHADDTLAISGGTVAVTKSYEGLEACEVSISGGEVSVVASDDGINAAGGSDSSSTETMPTRWGGGASSTGTLTISGGNVYVNAQGDGLDSNGSLYVTGGTVIVEGPTDNGNGALDKGDGSGCVAQITGGTVLAIGSTGMAVNFDSGEQCSGLVSLSGNAGTVITVEDGSGFTFTTSKAFQCIVYSAPSLTQGNSYTVTAGSESAVMDFSSGLYYSNVTSMGGGPGGMGNRGGEGRR